MIEIRARYEDWVSKVKENSRKGSWVGPSFGKKAEEPRFGYYT